MFMLFTLCLPVIWSCVSGMSPVVRLSPSEAQGFCDVFHIPNPKICFRPNPWWVTKSCWWTRTSWRWCWNWRNIFLKTNIIEEDQQQCMREKFVFGMCCRETQEVVMVRIKRCNKNTLWQLILQHVRPAQSLIQTELGSMKICVRLKVELMDSILGSIKFLFIKMVSMSGMKVMIRL